jgi:hypothetical protein
MLAACASGGVGSAVSPQAPPGQSAAKSHFVNPYEFWIHNNDNARTLQVINTHRGLCVSVEIPTMEVKPRENWGGIIDVVKSGSCFFDDPTQIIEYRMNTGAIVSTMEIQYKRDKHAEYWNISKLRGIAILDGKSKLQAPVRTACSIQSDNNLHCTVY